MMLAVCYVKILNLYRRNANVNDELFEFILPSSCQIRRDYNGQRDFELYNESALIAAC